MRILVITESRASRRVFRGAIEAAGHEVVAEATPATVLATAHAADADLTVVEAGTHAGASMILERARGAAERHLAAVVVLPDGAAWLRVASDDPSLVVIARGTVEERLAWAFAELAPQVRGEARTRDVRLRLDIDRGTLSANSDSISVTPSEAVLLDELPQEPGAVVRHGRLIEAIWGGQHPVNVRGALRMHVHTLRAKLAHIAPQAQITNRPHIGYVLNLR